MELQAQTPSQGERLRPEGGTRKGGGVGRSRELVVVPLEPWSTAHEVRIIGLDRVPADFGTWGSLNPSASGSGQSLTAEADPEDGNSGIVGHPQQLQLGSDPVADRRIVVDRPGRTHGDDEIEGEWVGKLDGDIRSMRIFSRHHIELDQVIPMVSESLPDRAQG